MTEAQLQAAIVHAARLLGWLVYHTFDSRRSEPGFPDLVMVRGDRVVYAELKRTGKRPTPAQRAWLDALEAAGCEVHVWTPGDWHAGDVDRVLARPSRVGKLAA